MKLRNGLPPTPMPACLSHPACKRAVAVAQLSYCQAKDGRNTARVKLLGVIDSSFSVETSEILALPGFPFHVSVRHRHTLENARFSMSASTCRSTLRAR